MNKTKEFFTWWCYTSCAVGSIALLLLLTFSLKLTFYTFQCYGLDKNCHRAWGHTDMFDEFMGTLVSSNPGMDIVATPKPSKK